MAIDSLREICAAKRRHVAQNKARLGLSELEALAKAQPPPKGFRATLAARSAFDLALIAEIKKASPSGGLLRSDFDPKALARAYREGGATCLSVLTDTPFFQGSDDDLRAARSAVEIPLLRKDFIIDPYQVIEARALGADCILLILAVADDKLANELEDTALSHSLDILIEVHDQTEMERAHRLRSRLVGINNRDLKSLKVDLGTTEKLAPLAPRDALLISESGLRNHADLQRLRRAGVGAFLVGESLLRQVDVAAATRRLLGRDLSQAAKASQ
jgi:indole-3-glycerol phosphate synthase